VPDHGNGGRGGGTICTWFDNDTFGELAGGYSESQTAAVLNQLRAAIEHTG
jgi:hypothetical protein